MFNKPRNKLRAQFEPDYLTDNRIFTPDFNKVTGNIKIEVLQNIERVMSITYGFRGNAVTRYGKAKTADEGPVKARLEETFKLFDKPSVRFDSVRTTGSSVSTLQAGDSFDIEFDYDFPAATLRLPSSCENLGNIGKRKGNITIQYQIYVKVNYRSLVLGKYSSFEYTHDIKFQGNSHARFGFTKINASQKNVYFSKLKMLLPDKDSYKRMKPNMIKDPHRHTRFVRQYFDQDYKAENIQKVAKDVPLILSIDVPSQLNICSSLTDYALRIECPSGLHLDPDFCINGVTTKLGFFEVEKVSVVLTQEISLTCLNKVYKCSKKKIIFSREFSDKPNFDVIDFPEYDTDKSSYYMATTLAALIGDTESTIFKGLESPVMGTLDLENYFSNKNTLTVIVAIGNAQLNDLQKKSFKLDVNPDVNCKCSLSPDQNVSLNNTSFYNKEDEANYPDERGISPPPYTPEDSN